jgi:hypothetical protein
MVKPPPYNFLRTVVRELNNGTTMLVALCGCGPAVGEQGDVGLSAISYPGSPDRISRILARHRQVPRCDLGRHDSKVAHPASTGRQTRGALSRLRNRPPQTHASQRIPSLRSNRMRDDRMTVSLQREAAKTGDGCGRPVAVDCSFQEQTACDPRRRRAPHSDGGRSKKREDGRSENQEGNKRGEMREGSRSRG